jgi:allantoin racemase
MKPKDLDPVLASSSMRFLIINPNTNPVVTERIRLATLRCSQPGITFEVTQPKAGPYSIETPQHREHAQEEVLSLIRACDTSTYTSILTACFDDLAIEEARLISKAPVYGTCELSVKAIMAITSEFSIVTTVMQAVRGIELLVRQHGGGNAFTTYAAGIGVEQAAAADKQTIHKVATTAAYAIRFDGSKAILLASGGLTGYASLLSDTLGVPIIDGVEAAIQSLVTQAISQSSQDI